ncbi:hypothetical protein NM688_g1387 [Phlebia brevispora]|uniref:Uncharacterized protein n=1 Tax=Phlebia brevispora TaxID=194682 RepID=A0ACC1TCB0_9APHY|nr:hypothetical protein NM688_g1387 [Phlebia brevispora]
MIMSPSESSLAARIGPPSSPSQESRKPYYRNRVWKRETAEATAVPSGSSSLMDRIELDSKSLLRRVTTTFPETAAPASPKPSLADRITSPTEASEAALSLRSAEEGARGLQEGMLESKIDLAAQFIASAIREGGRSRSADRVEEPQSPASEASVDNLLASVRDVDTDEERPDSSNENTQTARDGNMPGAGVEATLRVNGADGVSEKESSIVTSSGEVDVRSGVTERQTSEVVNLPSNGDVPTGGEGPLNNNTGEGSSRTESSQTNPFQGPGGEPHTFGSTHGSGEGPSTILGTPLSLAGGHSENTLANSTPSCSGPSQRENTHPAVDQKVLDEARRLFVSMIVQNAQLRDPDADVETLKTKTMELVTDEECLEFVRLANAYKTQVKEKQEKPDEHDVGGESVQSAVAGEQDRAGLDIKGANGVKRQGGPLQDDLQRARKLWIQTIDESKEMTPFGIDHAHESTSTTSPGKEPSADVKTTPKAPRAMLAHSERYAAQDFLHFAQAVDRHSRSAQRNVQQEGYPRTARSPRAVRSPQSPRGLRSPASPRAIRPSASPRAVRSLSPRSTSSSLSPWPARSQTDAETHANGLQIDRTVEPSALTGSPASPPAPSIEPPAQLASVIGPIISPSPTKDESKPMEDVQEITQARKHLVLTPVGPEPQNAPSAEESAIMIEMSSDGPAKDVSEGHPREATETDKDHTSQQHTPMEVDEPLKTPEENTINPCIDQNLDHEVPIQTRGGEPPSVAASKEADTYNGSPQSMSGTLISGHISTPLPESSIPEPSTPADSTTLMQEPPSQPDSAATILVEESPASTDSAATTLVEESLTPSLEPVLGLWFVSMGRSLAAVYDIEFEVSEASAAAAKRWNERFKTSDSGAPYACITLHCLPVDAVAKVNAELDPNAAPATVVAALQSIPTQWPHPGKLILQLNDDSPVSRRYFPNELGPKDGPLDMSGHIIPGRNTLKVIQLADLSACVFVLYFLSNSPTSGFYMSSYFHIISLRGPASTATIRSVASSQHHEPTSALSLNVGMNDDEPPTVLAACILLLRVPASSNISCDNVYGPCLTFANIGMCICKVQVHIRMAAPVFTPPFFIFLLTVAACTLLILVTFSMPFIHDFYFVHSSINGGIKFGLWGWCFDSDGSCTMKQFGYHFDPELIPILTKLFILYPIAAGLTLLTALTLLPVLFTTGYRWYPFPLFAWMALLSFLTSGAALGVATAAWVIAVHRFHEAGNSANLVSGPCIWMSAGATAALLLVSINAANGIQNLETLTAILL